MAIELWERWEHCCYWCHDELEPHEVVFDHYTPISLGGTDDPENMVLSCASCNASKAQLPPRVAELWFQEGQPRCVAIAIDRFERGLSPLDTEPWFTGAQWEQDEHGNKRVVSMPVASGQCGNDRCPDC